MKEGLACETKYNRVHATNLHAAQVLVHYLMIDPLSGIADYCQQTALEGSEPLLMIVHLSQWWDATFRIMADLFCCLLS